MTLKVAHGTTLHAVAVPSLDLSFGALKVLLGPVTGVPPAAQTLLLRGRRCEDGKRLKDAGVRPGTKFLLAPVPRGVPTTASPPPPPPSGNAGGAHPPAGVSAAEAGALSRVARVAAAVGPLEAEVGGLVRAGGRGEGHPRDRLRLNELLERQLLALDEIQEVPGSARAARKAQVSRIHRLLEQLDALPAD